MKKLVEKLKEEFIYGSETRSVYKRLDLCFLGTKRKVNVKNFTLLQMQSVDIFILLLWTYCTGTYIEAGGYKAMSSNLADQ